MKITDFKMGDMVKRSNWHTFSELNTNLHFELDLSMEDLLADDWEKMKKKVKKEGWIILASHTELTNSWLIRFDTIYKSEESARETSKILDSDYNHQCVKIEYEVEE